MEKTFEQSIKELEQVVVDLEKGDLSLDDSVAKFEEGIKISISLPFKNCCFFHSGAFWIIMYKSLYSSAFFKYPKSLNSVFLPFDKSKIFFISLYNIMLIFSSQNNV